MQTTHKAVRIHQFGGTEALSYEDAPVPTIQPDEVLVKIHASSINPVDWKVREGYLKDFIPHTFPLTLGWDFAGEVVAVGANVSDWKPGAAVYARPDIGRDGAYAEYIAVRANEIAAKPASINWQEAAAVPLVALTAWQSLYEAANIQAGERVLIHAGAGGVGTFAIQLAKLRGAYVITTTSAKNSDLVKALGADEVIDYTQSDFSTLRDIDVVFDTMGGEVQDKSWQTLKRGGRLVSIISQPSEEAAAQVGATPLFCFVQPSAAQLQSLATLIDAGKIKIIIDSVYPLKDIAAAHAKSATGRTRGKIVIQVSA
ncbi:NADP-dependent oxidoreductase [Undibacterium flavidum]|uniref:NADP-dependent oxidoreductase n=1 Tax=Undibacterium flavidum TaxID=2762297 RepID=A0ABR6Y7A6_9BURK|nr:NADP-dependent oxidoreductase [Undibacterium flavidum]MBC3872492.1 NADP-dependent oxidoreductase [Undibacterium flavidum]